MFPELRRLHERGFSLIWLKPKSKEPLGAGWTKKENTSFETFSREYREGYNVGVRLGRASRVDGGYLAVIDLDVKGTESKHQREALQKLSEIFPEAEKAPCVVSGRGNGSAHYYVIVDSPIRGNERKGQSREIVKVIMPSVAPSRREVDALSKDEIARGVRLRPAWEISLMCEGRQVVLPPSIHPDSGRVYAWKDSRGLTAAPLPRLTGLSAALSVPAEPKPSLESTQAPIKLKPVELETLGLRPDQEAAIKDGAGVTDRSAALFALAMALMQRGHGDNVILSVFTDRRYYLAATAYDHAGTSDRAVAANWVLKYTLAKARAQIADSSFSTAPAAIESDDWKAGLDYQPGPKGAPPVIRATFKNLNLILTNAVGDDFLRFDEFSQRIFWAYDTPWGCRENQMRSGGTEDEVRLKEWFVDAWGVEPSVSLISEILLLFSSENKFHPVREYLESLSWDGVERVDRVFETYLGANMDAQYLRAACRKFFLALVSRVFEPGCKFDHLPVLEGRQGIGKSSFGRILVGEKWFMDGLPDLQDKDAALNLQGIWLCEMSELSTLYRSQLEVAKAFITRQTDKVRPPYGQRRVEYPRQTVFIGTTNDSDYLVDETGNRRFWPVFIHGCDFKSLERDKDQLLAEAHWRYLFESEPLFLTGNALIAAEAVQESRRVETDGDNIEYRVANWIKKPDALLDVSRIRLETLFETGPLSGIQTTTPNRKAAGRALRKLGYERVGGVWVITQ